MSDFMYKEEKFYGELVHPSAITLANQEFFWDPSDELAPFGSDEGYEAFNFYCNWRLRNSDLRITLCIEELFKGRVNTYFSHRLFTLDYLSDKIPSDQSVDWDFFYGFDTSVIATGFGQFIKEGKIDSEYSVIMKNVLYRQLDTRILDCWVEKKIINRRSEILKKLLTLLGKIKKVK